MKIKIEVTAVFDATQELVDDIGRSEIIKNLKENLKSQLTCLVRDEEDTRPIVFPDNTKVIAYEVR